MISNKKKSIQIRSKSANKENNSNSANRRESQAGSAVGSKLNMTNTLNHSTNNTDNKNLNELRHHDENEEKESTWERDNNRCCCPWSYHTIKITGRKQKEDRDVAAASQQRDTFNSLLYQHRIQSGENNKKPGGRRGRRAVLLGKRRAASAQIDRICSNMNQKHKRNIEAINNLIESRRRVVRLSIILVLLFLFSWLPYHIVSLTIDSLYYLERLKQQQLHSSAANNQISGSGADLLPATAPSYVSSQHISIYIYPVVLCLALANSVTNPVCYITLSHGFRIMFKNSFNRVVNFFF